MAITGPSSSAATSCLQIRDRQPTALESVREYFDDIVSMEGSGRPHAETEVHETCENGHGRVDRRTYRIATCEDDVRRLLPESWSHVSCVGMCMRVSTRAGKTTTETHYHATGKRMIAEGYAGAVRSHWHVEHSLHWALDVIFGEDSITRREGNTIPDLTAVRKIVFNMTKMLPELGGLTSPMQEFVFADEPELAAKYVFEALPKSVLREGRNM